MGRRDAVVVYNVVSGEHSPNGWKGRDGII